MSQPSVHPDILTRDLVKALAEVALYAVDQRDFHRAEVLRKTLQLTDVGHEAASCIAVVSMIARKEWNLACRCAEDTVAQLPSSQPLRELHQATAAIAAYQQSVTEDMT